MISHMIRRPIPTPPKNDEPVAIAAFLNNSWSISFNIDLVLICKDVAGDI